MLESEFRHNLTKKMTRPTSLTFLLFFTIWSVLKGVESLIKPATTKILFNEYGLGILYYVILFVVIFGGGLLVHALIKRFTWGKSLGLLWLATGVFYSIYAGIASIINKGLMIEVMTMTREAQGRSAEGIAEFVNSSLFDITIIGTTTLMTAAMLFFIWKILQHKEYFLNKN